MRSAPWFSTLLILLLLLPGTSAAQEREIDSASLPRSTADRLIAIANDPATLRFGADSYIPGDSVIVGDVVVMGAFTLAGRIEGNLIVIHGGLAMEPGASVMGDITVIQGEITGEDIAAIGGTLTAYRNDSRLVQRGERRREVADDFPPVRRGRSAFFPSYERDSRSSSWFRFSVQGGDYNRVEGLPLKIGPRVDTGGRSPFRANAQIIWRTEGHPTFAQDRLGYEVQAEQFLGAGRRLRVGGGAFSEINPIEGWGLADSENSLATLLLTDDGRDHFERKGWRAFVRATPRDLPLDLTMEYRDEQHGVVGVGDPWTAFRRDREWRLQPLVAEGDLQSAVVTLEMDTRDDHDDPIDGWLARATWQRALAGSIVDQDPGLEDGFSTGFLDVRRYHPVGRSGSLALRGVLGGAIEEASSLPPQFQHALGGIGSLPGHARFSADCGARSSVVPFERDGEEATMYPEYGCDRFALAQIEYRGPIQFHFGFSEPRGDARQRRRHRPGMSWAVFLNAGQGWSADDSTGPGRADSGILYDAGIGLLIGSGGIYWARPLGNDAGGGIFTVRLSRRF